MTVLLHFNLMTLTGYDLLVYVKMA